MKRANLATKREWAGRLLAQLQAERPHPQTELDYHDPYTLLVAVVLSAQATDAGVNKATKGLFAQAATPQTMVALGEEGVTQAIKTLGLYRAKAKNVIALSQKIMDDFAGEVPKTREELMQLPGVGRKTANVVLNVVYGHPTLAVDTHVFRVAHRLGLSRGKTPDDVEQDLMRIIPAPYLMNAHHWLILHGRYTCKARQPLCEACPLQTECPSNHLSGYQKEAKSKTTHQDPPPAKRRKPRRGHKV
jgi:endonuclease-3